MRVLKNLLGDGSKIHAGEIQVSELLNLMDSVIVEEGSNNDGSYIRFGNGFQICILDRSETLTTITSQTLFRGNLQNWVFPIPFISKPYVSTSTNEGAVIGDTSFRLTNEDYTPRIYTIQQLTASEVDSHLIAIGKWK